MDIFMDAQKNAKRIVKTVKVNIRYACAEMQSLLLISRVKRRPFAVKRAKVKTWSM